jgi:ribose 5-phosphate isomerase A
MMTHDPADAAKRLAGRAALSEVHSGMTLGLGTGSTVRHFLEALGEALAQGVLQDIRGVPTSEDTARRARGLGIPLVELAEAGTLDLTVDGADEVDPGLDLIKGLGAAHLREKMVVQASRRFVVIADDSKRVASLGEKAPVPVEVVPFGWDAHLSFFRRLGCEPVLRLQGSLGDPVRTDNGNLVVDLRFAGGIGGPEAARRLDLALHARAGVVETGLFLGMARRCYLAVPPSEGAVDEAGRPEPGRVERLDAPE